MCDGSDIKPVTLGKGVRHTGFDLRGKARKNGKSRGDKRSNSDGCKSFDHDGPHVMEPWWPPNFLVNGYKAPVSLCLRVV